MELLKPFSNGNDVQANLIKLEADVQFHRSNSDLVIQSTFKLNDPSQIVAYHQRSASLDHSERKNELWKNTCFEIFFKEETQQSYFEINFNHLGEWNFYKFNSYRNPQPPELCENVNGVLVTGHPEKELLSKMVYNNFFQNSSNSYLMVNLTSVIKLKPNETTYWAVSHRQDKPDFHDQNCFILKRNIHGI